MEIADWRKRIDALDAQIVALLNERACCAREIGRLKRNTSLPIYEPGRERVIYENVGRHNRGPLPDLELRHVYERIIDVMRAVQREEFAPKVHVESPAADAETAG